MSKEQLYFHSLPILDFFPVKKFAGEIGIEIEAVGKKLPTVEFQKTNTWRITKDDSIKPRPGEVSAEYVLRQPISRGNVPKALAELQEEFKLVNAEPAQDRISNSVHVHINAQGLTMQQVYTWLTLYYIFEDVLTEYAGPHRMGNLFCLRARDAEYLINAISKCAKEDSFGDFGKSQQLRYSACNVTSLSKFGSIEFRALRGVTDSTIIQDWIAVLLAIKDKSKTFKDPKDVIDTFDKMGVFGFTCHVFDNPTMRYSVVFSRKDWERRLNQGANLATELAFATAWGPATVSAEDREKIISGGRRIKPKSIHQWATTSNTISFDDVYESLADIQPQPVPPPTQHPSLSQVFVVYENGGALFQTPSTGSSGAKVVRLNATGRQYAQSSGTTIGFSMLSNGYYRLAFLTPGGSPYMWVSMNKLEEA